MTTINNKLLEILQITSLDIKSFSKILKCDYVKMKRIIEGKDDASFEFIHSILDTFKEINPTWLMLNTGNILLKPIPKNKYVDFSVPTKRIDENKLHNDITKRIVQVRNMLGQNQTQFASNLDVRRQKIVAVESFRNSPSIYLLYNLVRKYQVRFEFLFFGSGSPFMVTKNKNEVSDELLSLLKKIKAT